VTGAAQGIGRRVCERLLGEGAQVIAVDRSELVFELQGEGVLALTADLEQYTDCVRVMAAAVNTFGRLDVLVNNVGGTIWAKPFEHYRAEEIE
ncbi:SDR family NAD(P)-dependent oxidoreductase, partial [Pseudomonas marginalis]